MLPTITEFPYSERWNHSRVFRKLQENQIALFKMPYHDEYTGAPHVLIAAGIIAADMLPGQPGRGKTRSRIGEGTPDWMRIRLKNGRHIIVTKGITKEESDRRHAEQNPARDNERESSAPGFADHILSEYDRRRMEEARTRSPAEFKEKYMSTLRGALRMVRHVIDNDGFDTIDHETICDFEKCAEEMTDILKGAEILKAIDRPVIPDSEASECEMKSDVSLQRFIKSVSSDLSLVDNEKLGAS